jgi:hypothetical protein
MSPAPDWQEIAPGLLSWEVYEPAVKCELTSTAWLCGGELFLFDPIPLEEPALERLEMQGRPSGILLTNGNHARAAEEYRRRFDCPIWAPTGAVAELGLAVDYPFHLGEDLPAMLRALPLASAGPGEVGYLGPGFLVLGDAVINLPKHGFALLPEKYCSNPRALSHDLLNLLSYEFHILTFAHGAPLVRDAHERLRQLLS